MRPSAIHSAAALVAASILLSACSGGSQGNSAALPQTVAPAVRQFPTASGRRKLYIANQGANDVDILSVPRWKPRGTITNGVRTPMDAWVDKNENLYVANNVDPNVTEFDSSGNLTVVYHPVEPSANFVTTDRFGDVYMMSQGFNGPLIGVVSEYTQGQSTAAFSCTVAPFDGLGDVAVDKHGNVFVSSGPNIIEYQHGLITSGCSGITLPLTFTYAQGIAFDTQGNLLVCDYFGGAVDISAPPYTNITGTLGSGWTQPYTISINKSGTQAYVTDPGAGVVRVLSYPGGSNVATLGSANGIATPTGAVASNNYVP